MKKQSKHSILKTPVMFSLCFFSFSISAPMQGDSFEKEFVVKSLLPSIESYFSDPKILKSSVFSFSPVISLGNAQENPEFELSLFFDNNSSKELIKLFNENNLNVKNVTDVTNIIYNAGVTLFCLEIFISNIEKIKELAFNTEYDSTYLKMASEYCENFGQTGGLL